MGGGVTFEAQVENDSGGASAASIASPAYDPNAGEALTVIVGYFGAQADVSLSDGASEFTLRQSVYNATDTWGMALFTATNVPAGSRVATASFTSSGSPASRSYRCIVVRRDSNVAAYDTSSSFNRQAAPGLTANAVTSGNATPGGAESRLQVGFSMNYGWTGPPSASTGFTSRTAVWDFGGEAGAAQGRFEDRVITSASPTAATFTATGNNEHYTVQVIYLEGEPPGGGEEEGALPVFLHHYMHRKKR